MHNIFADPKMREARDLLEKMAHHVQQGQAKAHERWTTCIYCDGKKFVQVTLVDYANQFIPIEVVPIPVANEGTIAVECDCHPHRGQKFYGIFGQSVKDSHLGLAIRRQRELLAAGLGPDYDQEEASPF